MIAEQLYSVVAIVTLAIVDVVLLLLKGNSCFLWGQRCIRYALIVSGVVFLHNVLAIRDWICIASAIPLSYILYFTGITLLKQKYTPTNMYFREAFQLRGKHLSRLRRELLRNLYTSTEEELLYRMVLQSSLHILISWPFIGIGISSIWFTAIHIKKRIGTIQLLDLIIFSMAAGVLYFITGNIFATILFHISRNTFIILEKHASDAKVRKKAAEKFAVLSRVQNDQTRKEDAE